MFFSKSLVAVASLVSLVLAETHTITMTNNCGMGTPMLLSGSDVLSTGAPYTAYGSVDFSAYLKIGDQCGDNGEDCPFVQGVLNDETLSHAAIFLFPFATYTVPTGYNFVGGGSCNGQGQDCTEPHCPVAVNNPTSPGGGIPIHFAGVNCTSPNVDFEIRFCD